MFGSPRTVSWRWKLNPFPIPAWMSRIVNKAKKLASILEQDRTGRQRQSHGRANNRSRWEEKASSCAKWIWTPRSSQAPEAERERRRRDGDGRQASGSRHQAEGGNEEEATARAAPVDEADVSRGGRPDLDVGQRPGRDEETVTATATGTSDRADSSEIGAPIPPGAPDWSSNTSGKQINTAPFDRVSSIPRSRQGASRIN